MSVSRGVAVLAEIEEMNFSPAEVPEDIFSSFSDSLKRQPVGKYREKQLYLDLCKSQKSSPALLKKCIFWWEEEGKKERKKRRKIKDKNAVLKET